MSFAKSGLSKPRLRRLHDAAARYIETGHVAGAISVIHRHGETVVDIQGLQDRERRKKLKRDSIFRIASMSKPITAVAAMILVEEGRLRLDEPVDRLLPELANRQVLNNPHGPLEDTVPANRPITLRDLLTFRLGFGMAFGPTDTPLQKAMAENQIMGLKPPTPHAPDEWIRRFGALPLMHQPGEKWMYHTGSDVLGVLIARAADMPFEAFLKQRIFNPLGMKDTGFHVPRTKLGRLCSCYQANPQTGALELYDDAEGSSWSTPPAFPAGGGGLVSTADDYLAFGRMMLGYGQLDGERILSRTSVEAMTTDQLTAEQKAASPFFPGFWDAHGWGFGVSVFTRRVANYATPGAFGWNGAFGTLWTSDPREDMVCLLMIQRMSMPPTAAGLHSDFSTLAYQAIDD